MKSSAITYSLSSLLGVVYGWVALNFWELYATNNLIVAWLLDALVARGYPTLFQVVVSTHDVIVNVLVAAPFAAVLVALRQLNHWSFAAIAAASAVIVTNWGTQWSLVLFASWGYWFGLGMTLISLPIAFAAIRVLRRVLAREGETSAA